ncbi:dihydrodipicolinate synthase family protein [Kallipyga massiliensis]|uniref:dihydrodipicolinate synthase family protein n=1 Tax=Kallipyga massiliensis TaxID=1472764 RepID=UPI0004B3D4D0|nr:dihydrodipicolinate synthase family protein [Kallipyga massiliensis]
MSKLYAPKGIIPVPPTPFNEDGTINAKEYKRLLDYDIERGVHCICIGGSTGEWSTMSLEERKELFKIAAEGIGNRIPKMATTGCHSLDKTLELTQYAVELGYESILLITPHYLQPGREATKDYYRTVAKTFPDLAVCIYNVPHCTNVELPVEDIVELAKVPNITGMKHCTDPTITNKIIEGTESEYFESTTGRENMILANLCQGGSGGMGVMCTIMPKELVKMYDLLMENNWEEALKIDKSLRKLSILIEAEPNPAPVKEVLNMMGFDFGAPRLPLRPCSDSLREELRKELKKLGYDL